MTYKGRTKIRMFPEDAGGARKRDGRSMHVFGEPMVKSQTAAPAIEEPIGEARAPRSFEAFFLEHRVQLFRTLWLIVRNRQEAEEIMQEAFVRVWERWPRVSAHPDPAGYLFRTALNEHRRRGRRAAVALRRATRAVPRDDELEAIEQREVVVAALAGLTPRERAAVVLTDALGFTSEEAARALAVRPSTVRVLARRGREKLRKEMTRGG
jgi:RNA polymerase sigma-70 factor (ECF subfamily)